MSASPRDDDDDLFGDEEPTGNGSNPNGEAVSGGEDEGPTLPEKEEKDLDDLFGSDDENAPPPSPPRRATSSAPTTPEGGHRERSRSRTPRNPLEYPEEEDNEGALEDRLMATLVPPIKRMESGDDKLWHLKLPSFVAIEPTPYNPDGFHKSASAKKDESQNGLQNDKKSAAADFLLAKNTIRWRWVDGPDGKPIRKSNARFVRWSDGSFSLQLGSDLFDVNASIPPTSAEDRSPSQNSSFPTFSSAADASNSVPKASSIKPDELPVTYIAHSVPSSRMPNVLAIQAPIVGNLSLLPTSMSSKTHMELVSHIERQHARESKLKMLDEAQDRELMMKSEVGAEIKARMKVRSVQRTGSGGGGAGAFGRSGNSKKKAYDSDDSDGPTAGPGYGRRGAHRPTGGARAGRPIGVDAGDYDEDDGFVVADSDESDAQASGSGGSGDSDAYGGSSRKKKSKKSRKRDYSPDAVEDADRLIEAASREKREQKRARREAEGGRSSKSEKKEKRRAEKERKRSTRDYESGSDEDEGEAKMTDEGEADMDMDVETEED